MTIRRQGVPGAAHPRRPSPPIVAGYIAPASALKSSEGLRAAPTDGDVPLLPSGLQGVTALQQLTRSFAGSESVEATVEVTIEDILEVIVQVNVLLQEKGRGTPPVLRRPFAERKIFSGFFLGRKRFPERLCWKNLNSPLSKT